MRHRNTGAGLFLRDKSSSTGLPMAGVASLARSLLMSGVRPDTLVQQTHERWQRAGLESLSLGTPGGCDV